MKAKVIAILTKKLSRPPTDEEIWNAVMGSGLLYLLCEEK